VPLTPKQQRFVDEYLVDLNATQAARRAGYSEATARQMGAENLSKPVIQEAIGAAVRRRAERVEVQADDVLRELARLGFSDLRDFSSWGPEGVTLRPSEDLPADLARCVQEVSQTISQGGGSIRFKLHSKTEALQLLGKHLGLFKEQVEHSGTIRIQTLKGVDGQTVSGHNGQAADVH